jgi:hypothetical protein
MTEICCGKGPAKLDAAYITDAEIHIMFEEGITSMMIGYKL